MDDQTVPTFTEFIAALSKQSGKKLSLVQAVLPDGKVVEYGQDDRSKGNASGQAEDVRTSGQDGRGSGSDVDQVA